MNGTQQQRVLQALTQASRALGDAAQVLGGSGGAGGNITVPALFLDFLPPEYRDRPRDFFVYSPPDITALAVGATTTVTFTVQQDSSFLICALAGQVRNNATNAALANPAVTVAILDSGSGRQFQNRPQAWDNLVGTGQLPSYLPYPKIVAPSSDVSVTYANFDPAIVQDIRLSFLGFKIFDIMT